MSIVSDPAFWVAAVVAVSLVGLTKGGFGGALGMLGVPIMALAIAPVQAAAILLPILVVMDMFAVWTWRGKQDNPTLKAMLPGALLGTAIGWALAAHVSDSAVRLIVGLIAAGFALRYFQLRLLGQPDRVLPQNRVRGTFWGAMAGFTSFVSHSGAPPYQVYALQLGASPATFAATSAAFFATINAVKLVPYFLLGQFDATNLATSVLLMPLAPLATLAGAALTRRVDAKVFFPLTYAIVFLVGLKLVHDGLSGLTG